MQFTYHRDTKGAWKKSPCLQSSKNARLMEALSGINMVILSDDIIKRNAQ